MFIATAIFWLPLSQPCWSMSWRVFFEWSSCWCCHLEWLLWWRILVQICLQGLTKARSPTTALVRNETWVWCLQLPKNIKLFLWLLDHQSIPTNLFRANQNLSLDFSCFKCGAAIESIFHVLLHYPNASRIWNMLHLDVSKNHNEDFQTCLQRHIKADYGAIFAVRCWQIWKACNVEIFQDKVLSDWSIIHQVQNLHDLISQTLQNSTRPLNITQVS